jgi:hypothetical protein
MKRFFFITLAPFFFCQTNSAPANPADLYARWFLNPTVKAYDSLASYKPFTVKHDSLAAAAKQAFKGSGGAHTAILSDTFHSTYTLGWKAPTTFRTDTTYPLIVYLHGGTTTMSATKGEIAYDMLSALGDSLTLFLASPSANRETPWWSPGGMERILQTVRFMTLSYPINPEKIFLAGVSDGAAGCYAAANTICGPFAGFIAVSGYGGLLFQAGMKLNPQNLMQRPILNINAGQDHIYPIAAVEKFLTWLEQNGVAVEHREYPDEKHGFDYRAKEYGNLATIIRTWKRPADTRAVSWVFVPGFPNLPPNLVRYELIPGVQDAGMTAFWIQDTLMVKTKGLKTAALTFDGMEKRGFLSAVNGARPVVLQPAALNNSLLLCLAQNRLFPHVWPQTVFAVKIP